jgi:hypothetical protein
VPCVVSLKVPGSGRSASRIPLRVATATAAVLGSRSVIIATKSHLPTHTMSSGRTRQPTVLNHVMLRLQLETLREI